MNAFDSFSRIYLINLPERTDRLQDAIEQLALAGLPAGDPRLRIFRAFRPRDAAGFPGIGAHGCYLSHMSVIGEALRDGLDNVLIVEDDIGMSPRAVDWPSAMAAALARQPWDFAYLGHDQDLAVGSGPHWQPTGVPLVGAHCYALNRPVMAALYDFLATCIQRMPGDPRGGPMHLDGALTMFRAAHPRCRTLLAVPVLAWQQSSRSDISANRWFDRLPLVRAMATGWRRARNRHIGAGKPA